MPGSCLGLLSSKSPSPFPNVSVRSPLPLTYTLKVGVQASEGMGALPKSWSWLETGEVRVVKHLCQVKHLVQGPQVRAFHHHPLSSFLLQSPQQSHVAVTSLLLHAQHKGSLMNLKDASVGIEAAGIENGIFPLVETGDFLLQVLVDALKRRDRSRNQQWGSTSSCLPTAVKCWLSRGGDKPGFIQERCVCVGEVTRGQQMQA